MEPPQKRERLRTVVSAAVEVDAGVVGHFVRDLNQILISPTHTGAMQRLLPVHVVAEGWLCALLTSNWSLFVARYVEMRS